MSEKRETILRLTQDATGKIVDVRVEQEPKLLTVIELKPETKKTFLRDLTEGSVVDWGDGTKSVVTAAEVQARVVKHTYASTSPANRVVTIDGVIDRQEEREEEKAWSAFDEDTLVAVRSLGDLVGEAKYLFLNCRSLTTIPEGLFDRCPKVTRFNGCFYGCNSLTSIPAGLFDHFTEVTSFYDCFLECGSLTAIPDGLFDRCTKVTNFSGCFAICPSLTSIPDGLFDHCPAVTDFWGCFEGCTSLTSIPDGLFDHCPAVTSFYDSFADCTGLTAIPEGLFDHCKEATSFLLCFRGCKSLTGETPYTMVDGKKVKLWERSPENGFAEVIEYDECFKDCTKLSDHAEIPGAWK